jgi:hypothetical protein
MSASKHGVRRKHSLPTTSAMVAAKGDDPSTLDFLCWKPVSPKKWTDAVAADVLPFEDLITIAQSIDSLLAWSANSTSVVSRIWQFESPDEIEQALKSAVVSPDPNEGDLDGYFARMLFSFLASVASVARNAHASERGLICFRTWG